MSLTEEWKHRVERWQKALWNACYRPLGSIQFSGYATQEQLTAEQALAGKFKPMPTGTPWGAKWEYAWLKGSITLPAEAAGKRIILQPKPGEHSEGTVWVNGRIEGSHRLVGTGHHHRHQRAARTERTISSSKRTPGTGTSRSAMAPSIRGRDGTRTRTHPAGDGQEHLWHLAGGDLPGSAGLHHAVRAAQPHRPAQPARGGDRRRPDGGHADHRPRTARRGDARDRARRARALEAAAGAQERPNRADAVCLWTRAHRCGLAVAAAGNRAQDGPHRHQPAGAVR